MKRLSVIFLILVLVACGNKGSETSEIQSNDSIISDTTKSEMRVDDSNQKDYSQIGADLMKYESVNNIKLGLKMSELIKILGEPNEKSKSELWGADGEYHQTFKYTKLGIELDFVGENDKTKIVNTITLTSPCNYQTLKGISIGSKYAEVEQAYKDYINPDDSNSTTLVAGSIYGGVIFNFEQNIVKSIFIGAGAE